MNSIQFIFVSDFLTALFFAGNFACDAPSATLPLKKSVPMDIQLKNLQPDHPR